MNRFGFGCAALLGTTLALAAAAQDYVENLPTAHPAVSYPRAPLEDPISRLVARLERGEIALEFRSGGLGFLPSLLAHLDVNPDSQGLVFSKTSVQAANISPRNPRAVYFNDEVAIGFVRGSDSLEIAALDPRQGIIFYTLSAATPDRPRFTRGESCLTCHQGPATLGVPGIFVSSVYPSPSGLPERAGAIVTDHRTLFEDRWGGWYVNGMHGTERHRGNAVAPDPAEPEVLESEGVANLATLVTKTDTTGYLSPVSDIVALMTFEHQTQMTNLVTRLGWEARIAHHEGRSEQFTRVRLERGVQEIVAYMLFADEPPLLEPVQGVSTFTRTFPERGPRDRRGRSLRDFDLHKRLFRYPLSYMVYSRAFDAMPDVVRERTYRRLYDALTSRDPSEMTARLSRDDKRAILEILRDTKPDLPAYWR